MYEVDAGDTKYMTDRGYITNSLVYAVFKFITLSLKYKNVIMTKGR
jgi:hypothetical protein